ncbi:hypothetical protein [Microbacterium candidum]|uniref:Uncharacterized protein n=1 Tax=Microbacterium candidum TaxID=3041922 RepID=A0ABT7N221_9MICO|nr:hypothetical protein [Microbacterium sp. ASV49]MDL9980737.1 hypothetical protein [Microbacterium sp. ASV49]
MPSVPYRCVVTYLAREGVDISHAGDTLVPAILVLQSLGFTVEQHGELFVAKTSFARFTAENPVALLGLVTIADHRRPWRASDEEIDGVMQKYNLYRRVRKPVPHRASGRLHAAAEDIRSRQCTQNPQGEVHDVEATPGGTS